MKKTSTPAVAFTSGSREKESATESESRTYPGHLPRQAASLHLSKGLVLCPFGATLKINELLSAHKNASQIVPWLFCRGVQVPMETRRTCSFRSFKFTAPAPTFVAAASRKILRTPNAWFLTQSTFLVHERPIELPLLRLEIRNEILSSRIWNISPPGLAMAELP